MKLLLTIIIVTIGNYALGQTKLETQEWIKDKIELNAYLSDDYKVSFNYIITFTNELMIIKEKLKYEEGLSTQILTIYEIPIKELTKIRFEERVDNVDLFFRIKNGSDLIKQKKDFQDFYTYNSQINIVLEKSIFQNDLKNKIDKAINHLIVLYGGKIVNEKF